MRPQQRDITPEAISRGLARVRETINAACQAAGRDPSDVRVLGAVKYIDAAACALLVDAGVLDLAENRAEELEAKQDAGTVTSPDVRWHYIGRLQSRQAPRIAARSSMIHTLCTESAAARLASAEARPELLVQVNIDGDPSKDGLAPDAVERFLLDLPAELQVSGLMAMPAFTDDPEQSRAAFSALRELRDRLATALEGRHQVRALSIGTSQDFAVAVEEGATHVRLGRILYANGE